MEHGLVQKEAKDSTSLSNYHIPWGSSKEPLILLICSSRTTAHTLSRVISGCLS